MIFKGIEIKNAFKLCLTKELIAETIYPNKSSADTLVEIIKEFESSKDDRIVNEESKRRWYEINFKGRITYISVNPGEMTSIRPEDNSEIILLPLTQNQIDDFNKRKLEKTKNLIKDLSQQNTSKSEKKLLKKYQLIIDNRIQVFSDASKRFDKEAKKINERNNYFYAENTMNRLYSEYLINIEDDYAFTLPLTRISTNILLLQAQMIFGIWANENIYIQNQATALGFCTRLIQMSQAVDRLKEFFQFGNEYFEKANEVLIQAIQNTGPISHIREIRIAAHYFWVAMMISKVANDIDTKEKKVLKYSSLIAEEGWACCVTSMSYTHYVYEHPNWFANRAKLILSDNSSNFIRKFSSSTNPILPRKMAEIYASYGKFMIGSEEIKNQEYNNLLNYHKDVSLNTFLVHLVEFFLNEISSS